MITWLMRVFLAVGLLGSAWVHLDLWLNEGFRDIETIGPLFLVNVVAGVILALGVLVLSHPLAVYGAILFGVATLAAYFISLTVGLFGVREQFHTAAEVWGVVTEVACIIFGIGVLVLSRRRRI